MKSLFLFAAGALVAVPAVAQGTDINHHARVGAAMRDGCHVQQVHTPAGKMVHNAPIVHCPDPVVAARNATPTQRGAIGEASAIR